MFRASAPIFGIDRSVVGVVVVSRHLDANLVQDARRAQNAYAQFKSPCVAGTGAAATCRSSPPRRC
jgi:hypothetical protein